MEDRTYSPQEAAWRGLLQEHQATGMRRRVHANGDITLSLFRDDHGPQPVFKATILPDGRVREHLMIEVIS